MIFRRGARPPGWAPCLAFAAAFAALLGSGCGRTAVSTGAQAPDLPVVTGDAVEGVPIARLDPLLLDLQERSFRYFLDLSNAHNGLVPDRWPTPSFASVAAVGFGLTAYPAAVERGLLSREEARARVLTTLRFFLEAKQGPASSGVTGYRGHLYHFLDMEKGERFETCELSNIDTALFMAGALFCQSYFDRDHPDEAAIRKAADDLYRRVDWTFLQPRPPILTMGWSPEHGFIDSDWKGYDEAMILYVLALGSPTHPIAPDSWDAWASTYLWGGSYAPPHVQFGPLFGHQFSHVFIDFRGIRDAFMREKGIDYFENSRRATLAQRAYAAANPEGFAGYGANVWGLSACDGPADVVHDVNGRPVRFRTYAARAIPAGWSFDDGTLAPFAVAGSLPFVPDLCLAALREVKGRWGEDVYGRYGFVAFNPTFTFEDVALHHGKLAPGGGWVDTDWLGIDVGPVAAMIENHRTGLVWRTMRKSPYVAAGLRRAGFTGGWLETAP